MVMLDAREALLLRGSDDVAIHDQRGSGVVVERREAEDDRHLFRA